MLNFCMIYKQKFYVYPLKSQFPTLSSIERESPLYFWEKGEVNQKLKKNSSSREHRLVYASRLKEVFEIRTVIHCVHIRSTVVLFKTTGQLRELGDSMNFPEVRNSNFGSPGTT